MASLGEHDLGFHFFLYEDLRRSLGLDDAFTNLCQASKKVCGLEPDEDKDHERIIVEVWIENDQVHINCYDAWALCLYVCEQLKIAVDNVQAQAAVDSPQWLLALALIIKVVAAATN